MGRRVMKTSSSERDSPLLYYPSRTQTILYEEGYITIEPHQRMLLFKLSPRGEIVAKFLREPAEENEIER